MKFLEPSFYTVRLPLRINAVHFHITYSCVINYNYKGGIFVVFPINRYKTKYYKQSSPESNQDRWLDHWNQSPWVIWHIGRNYSLDFTVWEQLSTRRSERVRTNSAGTTSKGVKANSATDRRNSIPAYYSLIAEERLCGSVRSLTVVRPVSGQYQGAGSVQVLRQQFWTIKGKQLALATVRRCIICCRERPTLLNQMHQSLWLQWFDVIP